MRNRGVTPRVAQRTRSAIDGHTTRHRGVECTGLAGYFVATAYNPVRMANLLSPQETWAVQSV